MTDFLSDLNEQQQEAVRATEGSLLILAGAGSGKTRVIVHRIAYLIAEKGVAIWNILAVTFTNKAAGEMRQRVQRLLRDQEIAGTPFVSTFHSLCVRILRQDIEKLDDRYTHTFTIYDQDDSIRLIKNCMKDLGYDEKHLGLRATQSAISSAKNRGEDVAAFAARAEYVDERRAAMARVYEVYEERLHANNALDFDDLMIKAVRLLRDVPEVREKYNNKFRYIMVDEYQDTNSLQFALISLLTERTQNIAVVGDEDQSIYKWRGADITNILNFEKHFPNTQTIRLEQNYRSTQTILDVAGAVVKNNVERKGKNLWTSNPRGDLVRYFQAFDAESEARFVAAKIVEHRDDDYNIRAAVLYRTNSQSRVFEEAMRRASLQYNIVGGFSFYERMEVRDIIAYLKLALNPNDSIALQRVINSPPRGIGKQTVDELMRRAAGGVQSPTSKVQRPDNDASADSSAEPSQANTGTAGVPPADALADSSAEPSQANTGTAGVPPADASADSSAEASQADTGTAGVPPALSAAGANSLSLWETIGIVIDDPRNLSTRAVSALKSFRRLIVHLSHLAGVEEKSQDAISQGQEGGLSTPSGLPRRGPRNAPALTISDSPVSEIVKAAILQSGYENALKSEKTDEAEARLENLQELVNAAVDYDDQGLEGLREFIDHSALVSDTDQYKENAPVTLMTAHSAKGLEFPLVFIVGLEDGLFPHSRSATDAAELEEERRLCYVAMTRAEKFLYVTHAMKRRVYGEELASEPSQFLNEMPLDLIEDLSRGNSWLSFARGSDNDHARGSSPTVREGSAGYSSHRPSARKDNSTYTGKTYDSVDSIAEFFKQRATQLGNTSGSFQSSREKAEQDKANRVQSPKSKVQGPNSKLETGNSKLETGGSDFVPGSYVKHAKYGRGLVLRREGVGESLKLTVTFPGYGQKKLVQKYAGLEKA